MQPNDEEHFFVLLHCLKHFLHEVGAAGWEVGFLRYFALVVLALVRFVFAPSILLALLLPRTLYNMYLTISE